MKIILRLFFLAREVKFCWGTDEGAFFHCLHGRRSSSTKNVALPWQSGQALGSISGKR
jgi:hypothetical protein